MVGWNSHIAYIKQMTQLVIDLANMKQFSHLSYDVLCVECGIKNFQKKSRISHLINLIFIIN